MTFPLNDGGMTSGLLLGLLFGFILEGAGFASPRKLVAQFQLRDFAVFKVMMTAVVVAAFGLWLAEAAGVLKPNAVYVPTNFLWSIALGGALIGAGFAVGGYCPGTAAAGLAGGRFDALVFIGGMVVGVWIFAAAFEPMIPFYRAGQGPEGQTVAQLFGLPPLAVIVALALVAVAGFILAARLERRHGGPLTVEDVLKRRS